MFKVVQEAVRDKWMMVAGTQHAVQGLAEGHAYTLLDSYTYKGEDILMLRNPWGQATYHGRFSKKDPIWKQDRNLAKALNHSGDNDGVFWIPVSTFRQAFDGYTVCMYEDWNIDRFRLKPVSTNEVYFKLTSSVDQMAIVTIDW